MTFTYLETFAGTGIGGIALDEIGGECVGFSEFDKFASQNYLANFPNRINYGDITLIDESTLPNFDLLIGGSPCTDISLAGRKWWGETKQEGLKGSESSLFFDFVRILNHKKPKWFIFENVRNLLSSNKGEDWKIVKQNLEEFYHIKYELLNTSEHGLPQIRRRIYIVGQLKEIGDFDYEFPKKEELKLKVFDLLEEEVEDKHFVSKNSYEYIISEGTKNFKAKAEINLPIARPLTSTMHKWHRAGQDNYYSMDNYPINKTNLRRLTPRECARLQGLPDTYKIEVSDTQAYRLMGNAMSLNVVQKIARQLKPFIDTYSNNK